MTDPPRGESVFGGLEAFDDNPDADAMDRMLLNLAASTDPPDWQLDSLPHDIYSSTYTPLPLQYMDTDPDPDPPPPSPPRQQPKRTPTSVCPLCGKPISSNGANFKRHEAACRRARAEKSSNNSSAQQTSNPQSLSRQQSPEETPQPQTPPPQLPPPQLPPPQLPPPQLSQPHTPPPQTSPSHTPPPQTPPPAAPSTWTRRDSDLLNVVRRLEQNINTLDTSARACLRDALLSLSNKASNPSITPTPQQEAMNRAAEFLVLRMLFLSDQQVMHTPPGTTPAAYSEVPPAASRDNDKPSDDDGTVAASTGNVAAYVPQQPMARPTTKREDKVPDQT